MPCQLHRYKEEALPCAGAEALAQGWGSHKGASFSHQGDAGLGSALTWAKNLRTGK